MHTSVVLIFPRNQNPMNESQLTMMAHASDCERTVREQNDKQYTLSLHLCSPPKLIPLLYRKFLPNFLIFISIQVQLRVYASVRPFDCASIEKEKYFLF